MEKNIKKAFSGFLALAIMISCMLNVSAVMFFKEDFSGTQYDVFGSTLKNSDLILNADTINVNNNDAITFFSIEDGKGTMKKIGNRGSYNTMGYKVDISQNIVDMNRAAWEASIAGQEPPAETPVFSDTINSGVWNFDVNYNTLQGDRVYFSLKNNGAEVFRFRSAKWATNAAIFKDTADETAKLNANAGNIPAASKFTCVTQSLFGNALAWENGTFNEVRLQFDFDNNTLNVLRYFNNKWVQVNLETLNLANFGVDLTGGMDEIMHEQIFHTNTSGECYSQFDYIKLSSAADDKVVYLADFNDTSKTTWWDYGFKSITKYGTAYMKDGGVFFQAKVNSELFTMDKSLNQSVSSGVWGVDFVLHAVNLAGASAAPSAASGAISNGRDFIEFMNDNSIALGIGTVYTYAHTIAAFVENGVVDTTASKALNPNCKKANGVSYEMPTNTGARMKFILDMDNHKLYLYMSALNVSGLVLVNPEGYTLPDSFTINKIRLKSNVVIDKTALAGFSNFEIYKLDSAIGYETPTVYKNGTQLNLDDWKFVAQNDSLANEMTFYVTPGATKTVKFITAVYDESNKLISTEVKEKTITTGLEVIQSDTTFTADVNGYEIKTFIWNPENYTPFSPAVSYDGIYPIQ